MGSDYLARKAAKKARQDNLKPKRERKKRGPRRLCKGTCYSDVPGLTEDDLEPSGAEWRRSPDGPSGELSTHAGSYLGGSKPGITAPRGSGGGKPKPVGRQAEQAPSPAAALDADADPEPAKRNSKRLKMSTAVNLLETRAAAPAAPRRPATSADGAAVPEAFAQYPASMQRFLRAEGYAAPLPVQALAWPALLAGRDVQAVAEPGSGKTLAYVLPAAELLARRGHRGATRPAGPLVVILTPTRELAQQVAGVCRGLHRHCGGLRTACLTGGVDKAVQVEALLKAPHLLVATPGRLLDLVDGGHLTLDKVRYVVLDEADKMLGLGFAPQVQRLKELLEPDALAPPTAGAGDEGGAGKGGAAAAEAPAQRRRRRPQVGLFTATMPASVHSVAADWLRDPERIDVSSEATRTAAGGGGGGGGGVISPSIVQVVQVCAQHKKVAKLLKHLAGIARAARGQRVQPRVLIFANRIKTVRYLHGELVAAGYRAALLHGERSQGERDEAVQDFRSGKAQLLVASDVAARGLDIRALPYVVNFDFPADLDTYIHRVGRTGRLAADGHAASFLTREMAPLAPPLLALLQAHGQAVDPNLVKLAEAYSIVAAKLGLEGAGGAARAAGPGDGGERDEEDDDGGVAGDGEQRDEGRGRGGGPGKDPAGVVASPGRRRRLEQSDKDEVMHALGLRTQQQKKRDRAQTAKRQRAGAADAATPSASVGGEVAAAAGREAADSRAADAPDFLPAKKFVGARAGYVFKKGGMGVGYYVDRPMLQQRQRLKRTEQTAVAGAISGRPVGGSAVGDAGMGGRKVAAAAAAPAPLLPGRLKQLNKRRRDADGMASDGDDDAGLLDLSGGADGATEQRGRPKQLPGRLRKKLAKQRAQGD